jgi:hypothetical protein
MMTFSLVVSKTSALGLWGGRCLDRCAFSGQMRVGRDVEAKLEGHPYCSRLEVFPNLLAHNRF